jgi:hypothetical protein
MFKYSYRNQSWRWGKPGILISDVELPLGTPVPGVLERSDDPNSEFIYYRFRRNSEAGTYIFRYSENGNYYSSVEGESAKIYNWFSFNRSGTGFIFFKPGAKVKFYPYKRQTVLRVLDEHGVWPYAPKSKEPVVL